MSNIYTLYEKEDNTSLSVTKNLDMKKFAIENLKTYPEENADATSKKYVDDENAKLLDLACTRQLIGDLDLNDNSIVGVHDINAENSVSSKKYIDDKLATKITFIAGNNVLEHYTFIQGLSFSSSRLKNVGYPTQNQDATTKLYTDRELAKKLSLTGGTMSGNLQMGSQKITNLSDPTQVKDATNKRYVDARKTYTYHFSYGNLGTTTTYPLSRHLHPTFWMHCHELNASSYLHLHHLVYDTDASITALTLTFTLDLFKRDGTHKVQNIHSVAVNSVLIPSERILFLNFKYSFSSLGNDYRDYVMCRLGVKASAFAGNEVTISCSIEI